MNTLKDKNFRTRCLAKVLAIAMVVGCLPAASVIGLETEPEKTKEAESTATVLTYTETEDKTVLDKFITDEKTDKSWEKSLTDFKEQLESEGYKDVQEAFDTDDMVYVGGGDAEETEGPTRFVRDGEQESIPLQLYDGEGGEHYLWRYCKADKEVDSEAVEAESEDVEVQNSGTELQTEFFWVRTDKKVNLEKWEETEEVREEDIQESEEVDTYSAEARATSVSSTTIFSVEDANGTTLKEYKLGDTAINNNLLSAAMRYAVSYMRSDSSRKEVTIKQWKDYELPEHVVVDTKGVLGTKDAGTQGTTHKVAENNLYSNQKLIFDGQSKQLTKATFAQPMLVGPAYGTLELKNVCMDAGGDSKSSNCQKGSLLVATGRGEVIVSGQSILKNGYAQEGPAIYIDSNGWYADKPTSQYRTKVTVKDNSRICDNKNKKTKTKESMGGIITQAGNYGELSVTDQVKIDNNRSAGQFSSMIYIYGSYNNIQIDGNVEITNNFMDDALNQNGNPTNVSCTSGVIVFSEILTVNNQWNGGIAASYNNLVIGGNAKITNNEKDYSHTAVLLVTATNKVWIKDNVEITENEASTGVAVGDVIYQRKSSFGKLYLSGSPKLYNNTFSKVGSTATATGVTISMSKSDFEKNQALYVSNLGDDAHIDVRLLIKEGYSNTNPEYDFSKEGETFGRATNEAGSATVNSINLKGLYNLVNKDDHELYGAAASGDGIQWKTRTLQFNVQNNLLTGDEITDSKNALLVDSKVTASDDITTLRNSKLYNELKGTKDADGNKIEISTRWTTPKDSKGRYTFAGWYKDAACKTAANLDEISEFAICSSRYGHNSPYYASLENGTTGDSRTKMVYAKWTPNSFKITYNLDGGNGAGLATSYTYSDNTVKLGTPTKDGYVFEGWYEGNTKVDSIPARAYGDKTYTARWTKAVTDNCPLILDLTNETFTGKDGKDVSGAVSGQIFGSSKIDLSNVDFSAAGCTENHTHTVIVTGKASKSKWIELSGEYDTVVQGVEAFREFRLNTTGKVTFTASADQSINQFTASNSAALTFGANVTTVSIDGTRVITSTSADKAPVNGAESKAKVLELSMHEPTSGDTTLKVADVEVSVPGSKKRIAVLDNLNGTWLTGNIKVTTETGKTYVRGFAENDSDSNASDDYSQKNVYGDTFPLGLGSDKNFGRYQEVRLPSNGKQLDVAVPTAVIFNIYTDGSGDNGFVAPEYTLENDSYTYEDKLEVNGQSIMFNKKEVDVDVSYKGIVAVNDSENEYTLREFTKMDQATMAQSEDKPAVCLDMTVNNGKDTVAFPLDETESSSSATVANAVPGANILQLKKPSAYVNDSEKRYYQVPKLIQEQKRRTLEGHHTLSLGFKID